MSSSKLSTITDSKNALLEIVQQAALSNLLQNYPQLPPAAIKVFIACVARAELEMVADRPMLCKRPSFRKLAEICNLSKATIQSALQELIAARLIVDERPAVAIEQLHRLMSLSQAEQSLLAIVSSASVPSTTPPPTTPPPPTTTARELPQKELSQEDDDGLIARYQNGEQEALAEIYRRHFDSVRLYVSQFLPDSVSYDVTQQIFMELMKKLKKYQINGKAKFTTWLHRFTGLVMANARRKTNREMQLLSMEQADRKTIIRLTSPQQQILPYMLTLDETQQHCVYLHYYEGLSYEDISEQLQLNIKLVRNYLQTARRHIRTALEKKQTSANPNQLGIKYNEYFYAALSQAKEHADQQNESFTFALLTGRSHHQTPQDNDQLLSVLGKELISRISNKQDKVFHLGNCQFALILRSYDTAQTNLIIKNLGATLISELSAKLAVAIINYRPNTPIDLFLNRAYVKLLADQQKL